MRERARRLARPDGCVDPALIEEFGGDPRHLRREPAVRRQHHLARLGPGDHALRLLGQRRVAIPVRQLRHAEPARLHAVIAVRQARIAFAHGSDEGVDHRRLDLVGEMPAVGDILEAAPAVGNLLVLGERVGDQREQANVVVERFRQRLRRHAPLGLGGVGEEVERLLEPERLGLSLDIETQCGQRLGIEPRPRAATGLRLLVEQLLDAFLELVGLFLPEVVEPRLVFRQRRHLQCGGERVVGDLVDLQFEEDEIGGDVGQLLGDVAVEFRTRRIGLVARVEQAGIGAETAHQVGQRLVGDDGFREPDAVAADAGEPALILRLDAGGFRSGGGDVALDLGSVRAGIEIGEVPLGHRSHVGGGGLAVGGEYGCALRARDHIVPFIFRIPQRRREVTTTCSQPRLKAPAHLRPG